jgi:hypothetical protein
MGRNHPCNPAKRTRTSSTPIANPQQTSRRWNNRKNQRKRSENRVFMSSFLRVIDFRAWY